jgi:acetate kinase
MKILVVNIGTTSLKYRLYDMESGAVLAKGMVERIGQAGNCPNYEAAIAQCLGDLPIGLTELSAIGFKAVHAGPVTGARLVDDVVLNAMEEFTFHAPAHNPPYIAAMRAFQNQVPSVPLVALFETAFFGEVPERTLTYSLPYEWKEFGIRRYGFHGASHRATFHATWAAVPVSRRFATGWRSIVALEFRRNREFPTTIARGMWMGSPYSMR